MKVLLDTNALIWWLHDSSRLGQRARRMIADPGVDVMVSIVSLWEISVKWRVSKLKFSGTALLDDLAGEGIEPIPVLAEHIVALDSIGFHHRDPFDHLLLAQAKVEKAAIITSDGEMPLYGVPCFPAGC